MPKPSCSCGDEVPGEEDFYRDPKGSVGLGEGAAPGSFPHGQLLFMNCSSRGRAAQRPVSLAKSVGQRSGLTMKDKKSLCDI